MRTLVFRNLKLFFKDRGVFFTSLITPAILLVLYVSFLGNVYRDSFLMTLEPLGLSVSEDILGGFVGGQLVSSLLAVSCVTVAFCSNMISVSDKVSGARRDLLLSGISPGRLTLSYCISTACSTLIVVFFALGLGLSYLAFTGWFLTLVDICLLFADCVLLALFGTALSSLVVYFLSSQGQISAVGTIVSSGYGFVCGAYMPISQFSEGLQKTLSFLPGTHGTVLLRRHALSGVFDAIRAEGLPEEFVNATADAVDANLYCLGEQVPVWAMYTVLVGTIVLLTLALLFIARRKSK